jgi:hypothetical protein
MLLFRAILTIKIDTRFKNNLLNVTMQRWVGNNVAVLREIYHWYNSCQ